LRAANIDNVSLTRDGHRPVGSGGRVHFRTAAAAFGGSFTCPARVGGGFTGSNSRTTRWRRSTAARPLRVLNWK
jgi:hypothetical protein